MVLFIRSLLKYLSSNALLAAAVPISPALEKQYIASAAGRRGPSGKAAGAATQAEVMDRLKAF